MTSVPRKYQSKGRSGLSTLGALFTMDHLASYGETHLAKRACEQLDSPSAIGVMNPESKRRCIENPWITPGISPPSYQIGDTDWDFPPGHGGDMSEDFQLQSIGGVDSTLSTGPLMNETQVNPSLNPIWNSASLWPRLPDIEDVDNTFLTPVSGCSGSWLQDEKTPTTTVSLEGDFRNSQTNLNGLYDVCFGMVSDLSGVLGKRNCHQFSHIRTARSPSILS